MNSMTTLPATWQEAQETGALRFARETMASFSEGNPFSNHSALSEDSSRAFYRHVLQIGMDTAANRMQIVEMAKAGDPDACDLLRAVLIEAKSTKTELPLEIDEYDLWLTAHGEQRRRRSEKRDYVVRDICIAMTIAGILDQFPGIDAMGSSARRRSACAITAEALLEAEAGTSEAGARRAVHLKRSYSAVRKIWLKYRHVMPTQPGWARTW